MLTGKLAIIIGHSPISGLTTMGVLCGTNTHGRGPRHAKFTRLFRRLVFHNAHHVPGFSLPIRVTYNSGGTFAGGSCASFCVALPGSGIRATL